MMSQAACAVGRNPRLVRLPDGVVRGLGLVNAVRRSAGAVPMLTPGKARELLHRDWSVRPEEMAPDLPAARFDLASGMAHTAAWYRQAGWLASRQHSARSCDQDVENTATCA
jgi:hypothetical protein